MTARIFFDAFAALAIVFAGIMVVTRHPVRSVLSLVVSFVGLAASYVTLGAPFIGVLQVIVYAGAILVLFLFVLMLLNLDRPPAERGGRPVQAFLGGLGAIVLRRDAARRFARQRDRAARRGSGAARPVVPGRARLAGPRALRRVPAALRGDLGPPARRPGRRVRARAPGVPGVIHGIPLSDVLLASAALFSIGIAGALLRRNAIQIFLSIELMMNAANLALIGYGAALGTPEGQIIVFFVIAIAAAEASVGLAIFVALFRHTETIDVNKITLLKW
jgi:NADH-quinone oxidoreductase subunit K